MSHIGTLGEKSLHAALKTWYARPGDKLEVPLDGYHIDIQRDTLLIEIQTRQFSAMKRKLYALIDTHPIRLVHPIPAARWLVTVSADGKTSRRKSPRRGSIYHVFNELVRFPHLMTHPNFSLEILMIHDEEIRQDDGKGSWRRRGLSIIDRRLLEVRESHVFESPEAFIALLPDTLPDTFTVKALAAAIGEPSRVAQRVAYCLRHMNALTLDGKQGNAYVYRR